MIKFSSLLNILSSSLIDILYFILMAILGMGLGFYLVRTYKKIINEIKKGKE